MYDFIDKKFAKTFEKFRGSKHFYDTEYIGFNCSTTGTFRSVIFNDRTKLKDVAIKNIGCFKQCTYKRSDQKIPLDHIHSCFSQYSGKLLLHE